MGGKWAVAAAFAAAGCAEPAPGTDVARSRALASSPLVVSAPVGPAPVRYTAADLGIAVVNSHLGLGKRLVGDVTGDGIADLVIVQALPGGIRTVAGSITGKRDFDAADGWAHSTKVRQDVRYAVIADVDGDGAGDVVFSSDQHDWGDTDVLGGTRIAHGPLIGRRGAAFARWLERPKVNTTGTRYASLGSVAGAGVDDVVILSGRHDVVHLDRIRLEAGAWRRIAEVTDDAPRDLHAIGDLDGDGTTDLALMYDVDDRVRLVPAAEWTTSLADLEGVGATIVRPSDTHSGAGWTVPVVGDFDGDGAPDVAVGTAQQEAPICALSGVEPTGTRHLDDPADATCWARASWDGPAAPSGAAFVPDLDGDGLDELALTFDSSETGETFVMGGEAVARGAGLDEALFVVASYLAEPQAIDVTGDGVQDLVFTSREDDALWVLPHAALAAAAATRP